MIKSVFVIFFSLATIMSMNQVNGQNPVFSFSPEQYLYSTDSFTIFNSEFMIEGMLHSNVNDTLNIIWQINGIENCPSSWKFKLNDGEFDYQLSPTVNSNYLPQIPWSKPIKLFDGHSTSAYLLFLYPEEQEGCCHLQVNFSLLESIDSVVTSADYYCAMIDTSCLVSSVGEIPKIKLNSTIVPNPTSGFLRISSDIRLSNIQVWNLAGMKLIEQTSQLQEINLSSLPNGTYLIKLESIAGTIEWRKVVLSQ